MWSGPLWPHWLRANIYYIIYMWHIFNFWIRFSDIFFISSMNSIFVICFDQSLKKKDSHLLKKNLSWIRWKYSNCWSLGEKRRRGQQWFWVGGYIYDHTKQGSTHLIKMHIIIRNLFVKRCCHCCNWTWTTYFWIFLSCSYVYKYILLSFTKKITLDMHVYFLGYFFEKPIID